MTKNIMFFFLLLFTLLGSGNAIQLELLKYQFEEGSGSIVLDSSGNNFHAINNGANYETNQVAFGVYNLDFDGNNDYLTTISASNIPPQLAISLWMDLDTIPEGTLFHMFDGADSFKITIDGGTVTPIEIDYLDVGATSRNQVLSNVPLTLNQMYHFVFNFNFDNLTFEVYRDNSVIANGNLDFQVSRESGANTLRIGTDSLLLEDYDGDIDEFRIFAGILNASQVNTLYTSNTITLEQPVIPEVPTNVTANIITLITPNNLTVSSPVEFNLQLNTKATCDFYLDNQLTYTFQDILAVNFQETLEDGEYQYFYYCEYAFDENTNLAQVSEIQNFNVTTPSNLVTFNIIGTDFEVNDLDLYIATPCPVKGFTTLGILLPYRSEWNPKGINWEPVVNGVAIMNLSAKQHEFCLFNGRLIVNEQGQTTDYNIQEANGIVNLGNITIPNQISSVYTLKATNFDVWDVTNPEAHGTTYTALIVPAFMLFLGLIIIFAGLSANNGRIVVAGVLLTLIGMGFSLGGLIGILL